MASFHHQPVTDVACFDNSLEFRFRPGGVQSYFRDYLEGIALACEIEEQFFARVGRKMEVVRCGHGDDAFFTSVKRPSSVNAIHAYKGVFIDVCRGVVSNRDGEALAEVVDDACKHTLAIGPERISDVFPLATVGGMPFPRVAPRDNEEYRKALNLARDC